jgi:hypothetical protein
MSAMADLYYEVAVTYFYLPYQMILVVHSYNPTAEKVRAEVTSPCWVVTKLIALVNGCILWDFAGGTACDGVSCGMGTCKEVPPLLPIMSNATYECDCDVGWARIVPILTFSPCYIPTCK